ncbi:MAG: TRAM domain-containing protein, partial [Actinomycetes bacterium]
VNEEAVGKKFKVLVGDYEGRRDGVQERMTGRSEDFRLVHFSNSADARPGDEVEVEITQASAHYLIGTPGKVRATRGGDAHASRVAEKTNSATLLGMPTVKP